MKEWARRRLASQRALPDTMSAYNHQHRFPLLCILFALSGIYSNAQDGGEFTVALWGDLPYIGTSNDVFDRTDPESVNGVSVGILYERLRDSINDSNAPFAFHTGDIKSGPQPCYTSKYYDRFEVLANSLNMPVFLTLGDNDWTDCHTDIGDFQWTTQAQALQYVRDRFYSSLDDGGPILGSNTETWSTEVTTAENDNYPELQRFIYNGIMFIVVHVVGSNNNLYTTCFDWFDTSSSCPFSLFLTDLCCFNARAEYNARNFNVNVFLRESFEVANDKGAKGVMVVAQADIFEDSGEITYIADGYLDFWDTLLGHTVAFGKPVVYVHGDSHRYKTFTPDIDGIPPNLQALRVPGDDSIGWVEATIDGNASPVFSFSHIDLTA